MTERELERQARHRLAVLRHVEEVSGNVAAAHRPGTCARIRSDPGRLLYFLLYSPAAVSQQLSLRTRWDDSAGGLALVRVVVGSWRGRGPRAQIGCVPARGV